MFRGATLFLLSTLISAPVYAQAANDGASKWGAIAGAGTYVSATYTGDDAYRAKTLPFLRFSYGDKFWASVPEGVNYQLWENDNFSFRAKGDVAFQRREAGDSFFAVTGEPTTDLLGLGNLGESIELGGDISYKQGPLSINGGIRQGFGGHGSLIGDASVSIRKIFKTPGPPIAVFAGPSIKFGEANLTQAYYGITPEQSRNSGLAAFKTQGGIYSYGFSTTAFIPTSERSAFILYGSLRELAGDAKNSPLIKERGEATQFFGGLFWVKAFGQDARQARQLITGKIKSR